MEDNIVLENVRSRLLFSGLKELEEHGVSDFSLRRVAQDAGVSCAAPYRHFKDKDELIGAVIEFIIEGWTLLAKQIGDIFFDDLPSLIAELAVAGLRFWIANGKFRTVIIASATMREGQRRILESFDEPILRAVKGYVGLEGKVDAHHLPFKILSMIYGAIILVDGGYESTDMAAESLRAAILSVL